MARQTTPSIESAIVLASANSLAEPCESSLEQAFRASWPGLLTLPKDKLLVVNVDVSSAACLGTLGVAWRGNENGNENARRGW